MEKEDAKHDERDCVKALSELYAITDTNSRGNVVRVNLTKLQVTDEDLQHIQGLVELRELNLSSTPVTNDGLKYCAKAQTLKRLYLGDTRIDDGGMQYVGELRSFAN